MVADGPLGLDIGGLSKENLTRRLADAAVSLNRYARQLFDAPEFTVSDQRRAVGLVTVSLPDLGLDSGGTLPVIFERANARGYAPCPLEVAAFLRLFMLDQPFGEYLTVASSRPRPDDMTFPAGFYLRRLEDGLWLRGYRTDDAWIFPPDFTRFVFMIG